MLYIKALHIIFVITWFAGLFYIVRLFVYHAESLGKPQHERAILVDHFLGAQRRLWYGITWPSAVLTWFFGIWISYSYFRWNFPDWLWTKLAFVAGLSIYHLWCGRIFNSFQRGDVKLSGNWLRVWNEVATVFLVAIVFIVVLKDTMEWVKGLVGLFFFSVALMAAIRIYKRIRQNG